MATASPTPAPPAYNPQGVPPPLRHGLVKREQSYLGRKFIILKNSIGLNYYRLPVAHTEAADKFDGVKSFAQIIAELRVDNRFWRSLSQEKALQQITQLSQQLASSGLLRVPGGSAIARAKIMKQNKRKHLFELSVGKVLYFRKSFLDPDEVLESMLPWFSWIYTKTTLTLIFLLFAATAFDAARHWDEIKSLAVNFFTFENLALTWVLFFGVKIIHEFGHGLTCKRYGGEVHEMGFMFILFTPYLFCNVSDSWLADKKYRVYVTAAGIFVELIIACFAFWLWLGSQPGLFKQMCFNTMFLCSISTIIFNANPLLKFDGYYIMTDLLEIPNLKQKSSTYITNWAQKVLLGIKSTTVRLVSYEQNPLFGVYAVLAYVWGWLVLFNISTHMFNALKPYGLEILSRTYVGLFLFVSIALPLYRLANSVKSTPEIRKQIKPRVQLLGGILAGIVIILFFIPWQDTIKRTVVLEHVRRDVIAPQHQGFLKTLNVQDGQEVKKGEVIGQMEDEDLFLKKRDLELEKDSDEVRYRFAVSSSNEEVQLQAPAFRKMSDEIDEQLTGLNQKIADMTLRAPNDGIIRTWQPERLLGRYFKKGSVICEIGSRDTLCAIIPLNEQQARRVRVGQKVRFRLFSDPMRQFTGTITSLPLSPLTHFTSPVLANLFGGDVPAEGDPDRKAPSRPSVPHFEAEVTLDEYPGTKFHPGMMGKARIYANKSTLGLWLVDRAYDFVNPEVRL